MSGGWQAGLGIAAKQFRFKEFSKDDDRLVREQGMLPGLTVTGKYSRSHWDIGLDAKVFSGKIDYDGQTQFGQPLESETDESVYELDLISRYLLFPHGLKPVSVYVLIGAGTRLWKRDIKGSGKITGLDEEYSWHMFYAGTVLDYLAPHGNQFTLDARITQNIDPEVEVRFNNGFDDVTLDLGQRNGFRLTASWTKTVTQNTGVTVRAFLEQWKFGASNSKVLRDNSVPVGSVFQPRSETREIGVGVTIVRHW